MKPLASQHIARNTLSLILREALGIVCLFVTNIILSRYLGLDGMGRIACYSSTFMALLIFAEFGTPRALTILGAKSLGESTHITTLPSLLWASLAVGVTLWAVQIALFFGVMLWGNFHFLPSSLTPNVLIPLLGSVPFLLLYANACGLFNGFRMMDYTLVLGIIYSLSYLMFVSVPVVLGGKATGVVWSWFANSAITGIVSGYLLLNFLSKQNIPVQPLQPLAFKKIFKLGVKLWGQGAFYYQYGVLLSVSFLRPESEAGLMMISFALINLSEVVFGPLEIALTASVATAQNDASWAKQIGELQPPLMRTAATLKLLAVCIFAIIGKELLSLFYGAPFREAYSVLVVLSLVLYFDSVKYVTDPILNASGRSHLVMVAEGTKIILATVLSAILAVKYNIIHVATSLLIASTIPIILKIFFVSGIIGQRIWKPLFQVSLPWMAAVAAILSMGLSWPFYAVILLILIVWIYFLRNNLSNIASILVGVLQNTVGFNLKKRTIRDPTG